MLEWLQALSPIMSTLLGIISYATLTNYRLDKLDEQVSSLNKLRDRIHQLETRVSVLENRS